MTRKPDTEKQKKDKAKYKNFGKPNPKKEKELREHVIRTMEKNPIVAYIVSKAVEQVIAGELDKERCKP